MALKLAALLVALPLAIAECTDSGRPLGSQVLVNIDARHLCGPEGSAPAAAGFRFTIVPTATPTGWTGSVQHGSNVNGLFATVWATPTAELKKSGAYTDQGDHYTSPSSLFGVASPNGWTIVWPRQLEPNPVTLQRGQTAHAGYILDHTDEHQVQAEFLFPGFEGGGTVLQPMPGCRAEALSSAWIPPGTATGVPVDIGTQAAGGQGAAPDPADVLMRLAQTSRDISYADIAYATWRDELGLEDLMLDGPIMPGLQVVATGQRMGREIPYEVQIPTGAEDEWAVVVTHWRESPRAPEWYMVSFHAAPLPLP